MRVPASSIALLIPLLALLFVACSGSAEPAPKPSPTVAQLSPTPTATPKVSATATPTPSEPRMLDIDAIVAAVQDTAPGYVEQPPSPANLAALDGLLAFVGDVTSFGGDVEHWTLEFEDGGAITVWVLIPKGDGGLTAVRD